MKFITAILLMCFSFAAMSGEYKTHVDEFTGEKSVFFVSTLDESDIGANTIIISKWGDDAALVVISVNAATNCKSEPVKVNLAGTFYDYSADDYRVRHCYFFMPVLHLKGVVKFKVPMMYTYSRVTSIDFRDFDINRLK